MPMANIEPSKAEPAPAKKKVRKLVLNSEKDSPKACAKPILISVEDEILRGIQEKSGK